MVVSSVFLFFVIASAAKQSIFDLCAFVDCLAALAMTVNLKP